MRWQAQRAERQELVGTNLIRQATGVGTCNLQGLERTGCGRKWQSVNDYLSHLRGRGYLESGGAAKEGWIVAYGKKWPDAWREAYAVASKMERDSGVWDSEFAAVKDALRRSAAAQKLEPLRREIEALIKTRLRGAGKGLQPDVATTAVEDAYTVASLLTLRGSEGRKWLKYLNIAVGADEAWQEGFGRFAMIRGEHIVYGIMEQPMPANVIPLQMHFAFDRLADPCNRP